MTIAGKTGDLLKKIGWASLLFFLVLAVFYAGYQMDYAEKLKVRAVNGYCPTGTRPQIREGIEIPGHTVVLIDTSNRITEEDGKLAFERIDELIRDTLRTPFLQKVSIYGLSESESEESVRSGRAWCVPKQGEMANRLYENPQVVALDFRDFINGVRGVFESLRSREEAEVSPIAETMAYLVERYEDLDSFVIVSDMLQHTSLWNAYAGGGALSTDAAAVCIRITQPGTLKAVYVYYIDRQIPVQSASWPTAGWQQCLAGISAEALN